MTNNKNRTYLCGSMSADFLHILYPFYVIVIPVEATVVIFICIHNGVNLQSFVDHLCIIW